MEEGAGTGGVKVGESTRGQGKKKVKKRDTTGWSRQRQVSERLSMHWSVTEGSSKSERINDLKMETCCSRGELCGGHADGRCNRGP